MSNAIIEAASEILRLANLIDHAALALNAMPDGFLQPSEIEMIRQIHFNNQAYLNSLTGGRYVRSKG